MWIFKWWVFRLPTKKYRILSMVQAGLTLVFKNERIKQADKVDIELRSVT
jgi:hypothetical protein